MHSIYQRINNASSLLFSCLFGLFVAIAASSVLIQATRGVPETRLEVTPVKVYKGQSEHFSDRKQEFAFHKFDYKADLTPLFDWNTKQLFLYLSAEYTNAQGVKNDVVIWDRIIRRKKDAKINIKGVKNKYRFRELSTTFRNVTPAEFVLKYNAMPYVGMLTFGEAGRTPVPIPFPPAQRAV